MAGGFAPDGNSPTYQIPFSGLAATVAMDLVSLLPPTNANYDTIRLRRVVISNPGAQTGAALVTLQVGYAGAALGSGGTNVANVRALDQTGGDPDLVAGVLGIVHTGDSTPAASFVQLASIPIWVPAAVAVATPAVFDFGGPPLMMKCPTVAGAVALALKHPGAAGASALSGYIVVTADPA